MSNFDLMVALEASTCRPQNCWDGSWDSPEQICQKKSTFYQSVLWAAIDSHGGWIIIIIRIACKTMESFSFAARPPNIAASSDKEALQRGPTKPAKQHIKHRALQAISWWSPESSPKSDNTERYDFKKNLISLSLIIPPTLTPLRSKVMREMWHWPRPVTGRYLKFGADRSNRWGSVSPLPVWRLRHELGRPFCGKQTH